MSTYAERVLGTTGIVGLWELGETEGKAIDLAAANDGTYNVTPREGTFTNTPERGVASILPNGEGKGAKFNGASSGGAVSVASSPTVSDAFTFEAWIKMSSVAGSNGIITRGQNGGYVRVSSVGRVELLKSQVAGIAGTAEGVIKANTVYHVVATKSGAKVRIYVNGELVASTNESAVTCAAGEGGMNIGCDYFSGNRAEYFRGTIQYAACYRADLSEAEVKANYEAGSAAGYETAILGHRPLVSLFELGEAEGNAIDALGRGHPSLLPAKEGHAVVLTENDYVQVAHAESLDVGDEFTLQAYVIRSHPAKTSAIISKGTNGCYVRINENGKVEILKSQVAVILTGTTALSFDTVYHVTVTKKGAVAKVYIDGVLDASTEESAVECANNERPLRIGADTSGGLDTPSEQANAIIQYAAIYNKALTEEQIQKQLQELITVKIMLSGEIQEKPRYVLVGGEPINA